MSKQDFTVINETGVLINALFVSAADDENWEDDILGQDQLGASEEVEITFPGGEDADLWDLRVEDADGNFITWEDLNLSAITRLTLHWDGSNAKATWT